MHVGERSARFEFIICFSPFCFLASLDSLLIGNYHLAYFTIMHATLPLNGVSTNGLPTNGHSQNGNHVAPSTSSARHRLATRLIHEGSEASAETGAVIPGISLSTTYKQTAVGQHQVSLLEFLLRQRSLARASALLFPLYGKKTMACLSFPCHCCVNTGLRIYTLSQPQQTGFRDFDSKSGTTRVCDSATASQHRRAHKDRKLAFSSSFRIR
jgi:hypothetical protein